MECGTIAQRNWSDHKLVLAVCAGLFSSQMDELDKRLIDQMNQVHSPCRRRQMFVRCLKYKERYAADSVASFIAASSSERDSVHLDFKWSFIGTLDKHESNNFL